MQAIRQYATVHDNTLVIHLPEGLNEQKVEIIVLPTEDSEVPFLPKIKLSSLKGSMTSESERSIDAQLKSIRDEWERPIS